MVIILLVVIVLVIVLVALSYIAANTCPKCKSLNNTVVSHKLISQKPIQIKKQEVLRHYSSKQTFGGSVKGSEVSRPDNGVTTREYTVPGVRETFEVLHRCNVCGTEFTSEEIKDREI